MPEQCAPPAHVRTSFSTFSHQACQTIEKSPVRNCRKTLPDHLGISILKVFRKLIYTLPVVWLLSCSAPHDNPLDPASPNYVEPETTQVDTPPPTFSSIVRSVHRSRTTIDVYSVKTELWPDSNLTIDSVTVQYKATTPRKMTFFPNGRWQYTLNSTNVGDNDLESAVGEPFYFKVYEANDSIWTVGPKSFVRVIHDDPITATPSSGETVSPFPTLAWEDFGASYPIRYQAFVEIEDLFNAQIDTVWISDTLSSNVRSIQVTDSLFDTVPNTTPDSLFFRWALIVYDNFGNSSISVESTFNVQAGDTL